MLDLAPLAMIVATLLAASPLADTVIAESTGVATARKGLQAIDAGVAALEQNHDADSFCDVGRPPTTATLAETTALLGCVTETVSKGATQAAGLATALNGLLVLGASVPMVVGEAAPPPDAVERAPLGPPATDR